VINVKILSLGDPERYAVRRLVLAAQQDLLSNEIKLKMTISELSNASEIGKYAFVLVLPTLVLNEKVVCSGRFPTKEEISQWLRDAIEKN
jgi:hypothetical protein